MVSSPSPRALSAPGALPIVHGPGLHGRVRRAVAAATQNVHRTDHVLLPEGQVARGRQGLGEEESVPVDAVPLAGRFAMMVLEALVLVQLG
ncbi:unnamed protein product [Ectocarpus sp. CCAP 1310/34]|nr:unnamed protein product [Ectocarpus sp. CCAP 1310/34]